MATAFVHVGQAGLQLAEPFWSLAREHPSAGSWLFDDDGRAHCLLADCEPRVVRTVARSLRGIVRADASHVLNAHGSANNWAMGFTALSPESLDSITDSFRQVVERMDWWSGTVVAHSLAGGTGSGVGSRLLLELRDAYPRQWLVSAAMLPFATGDSALQNYNAALALAHVQEHADLALLFENGQLLADRERLGKEAKRPAELQHASMGDLNEQIACALGGALFPLDSESGRPRANDLGELVAAVSPMPGLKLASAHTVHAHPGAQLFDARLRRAGSASAARVVSRRQPIGSWDTLSAQLSARLPRFHSGTARAVTLSASAVVRGGSSAEMRSACTKLERALGASPLSPFNVEWRFAPSQNGARGVEQSLSLVSNRTSVEAALSQVLRRAGAQLDAGAYVHHYERYGCSEAVLRGYVDECWDVVANYRHAAGGAAGAPG